MKILVTGGSGFVGSHIVDRLIDGGDTVRIFDMVLPSHNNSAEYYKGSLLNYEDVRMSMNNIDYVFHLAAIADVKDVFEEPLYAEEINVRGTINVLDAARKGGIKRVIYGSTTWVYSDVEGVSVDEDTPLHAPSHLYTATKMISEYYCKAYTKLYDLPTTILRYGIPYGPRAREGGVVPIFVKKALNGEPITIAGDGLQYRKFVYVEDLAEGNVAALKPIAKNKIYNLDGNRKISIKEIADTIAKFIDNVKIDYVENRPGDFSGKEVSSERSKKELNWEPSTSFEDGVQKYIEWYKKEME